jgi:hypothetical protein
MGTLAGETPILRAHAAQHGQEEANFGKMRVGWAVSSAVEHCLHTAGVVGSKPIPPTNRFRGLRRVGAAHFHLHGNPAERRLWNTPNPGISASAQSQLGLLPMADFLIWGRIEHLGPGEFLADVEA